MRTVVVTAIGSFSADIVIKKCRENGMRVIGCDVYPGEWIADAGNVDAFYQVPYASDTDHYIETMLSICRKEGAKAVIPLTDAEIDVFNLHRREFGEINAALCMSDKASAMCPYLLFVLPITYGRYILSAFNFTFFWSHHVKERCFNYKTIIKTEWRITDSNR